MEYISRSRRLVDELAEQLRAPRQGWSVDMEDDGDDATPTGRISRRSLVRQHDFGDENLAPAVTIHFPSELECGQIQFESSTGSLLFRDKRYIMCAAGIPNFNALQAIRRPTNYNNGQYKICFKKSDYNRSKCYDGGRHGLTLYVNMISDVLGLKDEKCEFVTEEKFLNILLYGIHKFNYDVCQKCIKPNCEKKLVSAEPIINTGLPEELFNI